jgi:hypothetical protein
MAALKMRTQAQEMQLQHRTAHNYERDAEIDNQSGNIDKRGNKWGGRGRRICTHPTEQEWQH